MSGRESERFWVKVQKTETCWLWTAAENGRGYGRFSTGGRLVYAHRWAYESVNGSLAPGTAIDHLCREPRCVRPDHLEAVTWATNTRRSSQGFDRDGTCRRGLHDITKPENVRTRPDGRRICHPCAMESQRVRRSVA